MATKYFRGDAAYATQVTEWVFAGTWETTDIITVTINNKTVTVVAGSATIATLLATLVTALNNSTHPEFAEITWSANSPNLIATCDTAGRSFTATVKSSETGGGNADAQTVDAVGTSTLTATGSNGTNTTAPTGPNWLNLAANWSGGTLPADGDDVVFADCEQDIDEGLDMSSVSPASIRRYQTFTGAIGRPRVNELGDIAYVEYRETYAKWGVDADNQAITVYLGLGEGDGPALEKWNFGDCEVNVNVLATGNPLSGSTRACYLLGTHADNVVNVKKGKVAIAGLPGEVSTVDVLRMSYVDSPDTDADVVCGVGVTLDTVEKDGGVLELNNSVTTLFENNTGETNFNGGGALDSPVVRGGVLYYSSTGTLAGNAVVSEPGRISFDRDPRPKAVTNPIEVYGRNPLTCVFDRFQVVASLVLDWNQTGGSDLPIGNNVRLTRATPS